VFELLTVLKRAHTNYHMWFRWR